MRTCSQFSKNHSNLNFHRDRCLKAHPTRSDPVWWTAKRPIVLTTLTSPSSNASLTLQLPASLPNTSSVKLTELACFSASITIINCMDGWLRRLIWPARLWDTDVSFLQSSSCLNMDNPEYDISGKHAVQQVSRAPLKVKNSSNEMYQIVLTTSALAHRFRKTTPILTLTEIDVWRFFVLLGRKKGKHAHLWSRVHLPYCRTKWRCKEATLRMTSPLLSSICDLVWKRVQTKVFWP